MNKYVVTTLVMVVLLVGLAEVYFALSWDEHVNKGEWRIKLNLSVQEADLKSDQLRIPDLKMFTVQSDVEEAMDSERRELLLIQESEKRYVKMTQQSEDLGFKINS